MIVTASTRHCRQYCFCHLLGPNSRLFLLIEHLVSLSGSWQTSAPSTHLTYRNVSTFFDYFKKSQLWERDVDKQQQFNIFLPCCQYGWGISLLLNMQCNLNSQTVNNVIDQNSLLWYRYSVSYFLLGRIADITLHAFFVKLYLSS